MNGDGCTYWFDGDWRHCCDAHDAVYMDGSVNWQSHIELGQCVAQTTGGLAVGVVMMVATSIWWLVKRNQRNRNSDHIR